MNLALSTGKRTLAPDGAKYNYLFEKPVKDDLVIMQDGTVEQTVREMVKMVKKYNYQTTKLAKILQGNSVQESASNIWNFIYKNIQYREDQAGVEQLRTPARTWNDRISPGADCDCMSIFAGCLLASMGIEHKFRIVKYGKPDYQHVYVVIPNKGLAGKDIIIDGVLDKFNYQLDFTQKKDFMSLGIPIQILNGIGNSSEFDESKLLVYLKELKDRVKANPEHLTTIHWRNALEFIDYILHNYSNANSRVQAITQVAKTEEEQFSNSLMFRTILAYVDGRVKFDDLSNTWINVVPTVGALGKAKNNAHVVFFAPARGAYLLLLKANMFHWADKMVVGFFGGVEDSSRKAAWEPHRAKYAAAFGMTVDQHKAQSKKLLKILEKWHDKLGGDWSALKSAVMIGSLKMRHRVDQLPGKNYWVNFDDWAGTPRKGSQYTDPVGLGGVGEPECIQCKSTSALGDAVGVAAILSAAAAIIVSLAPLVSGLVKPGNADPSISDSGDPYADAAIIAELEEEARRQGNPPSSGGGSDTIKTVGIIAGVLALIGGAYMLMMPDKKSKARSNAK